MLPGEMMGCHHLMTVEGFLAARGSSRVTVWGLSLSVSGSKIRRMCHMMPLSVEKSTMTPSLRLLGLRHVRQSSELPILMRN